MGRPNFADINSGQEFNRWYWLKSELQAICTAMHLPATGRKFDLRDRIMYALDNDGDVLKRKRPPQPVSTFDWRHAELTPETVVTDNVSFGPNFRSFMAARVDRKFTCTSDFMDWVREHEGATLADCVAAWQQLEDRRRDPDFQRRIAANNMFCQYVRDFYASYPDARFEQVKSCWLWKRKQPMVDGRVIFSPDDAER